MRITLSACSLLAAHVFAGCGDCSEEDLDGTYVISFDERSGDCGSQTEAVVRYSNGKSVGGDDGADCDTDYDKMSDDACTQESKGTCVDSVNGITITMTFSLTEDDKDGAEYSGVASLAVSDLATGDYICKSTYDVEAVRE